MKKIFFSEKKTANLIFSAVFAFLSFSFLLNNCYSQWSADTRLTNDAAGSYTSLNNKWCVAANGSVVHAVWQDHRDGNGEIYYKRSADGGATWGADTRLTNNTSSSLSPCVAVSGAQVNVVWYDNRDGNFEIYFKRSTDGGVTWGTDTRLTNNSSDSYGQSASASGTRIYIVWTDYRDGNEEIYHKYSTDGGTTWSADMRLTNNTSSSGYPSVAVSGLLVNVVWQDNRDGNNEIYYKRSTDGGVNWDTDTRLTNNTYTSEIPSVALSGSQINVVWGDGRDGNMEIYYKRSTDGGLTWEADTRLTNNTNSSREASVAASGSVVNITWRDDRDGNQEIYYKRSTDGGVNWDADTRLTSNSAYSYSSSIAVSGSQVHIVWYDDRDGNNEIYYKQTLPPVPAAPSLISPLNNSVGQPLSLNLIWGKSQYTTKYRLLLAVDSMFTNILLNDSLLTDSLKSVAGLSPLTYYYWKVCAGNISGWSSYSSAYKFKTTGSPTQVTLFSPANNAVNQPVSITFKWYKAADQTFLFKNREGAAGSPLVISNYWFELATDAGFTGIILRDSLLTDTTRAVTGLNSVTTYYWRVKAKNVAGWGTFSAVWSFATAPPLPAAPVLVSPANNATNLQPNVLLDWNSVLYSAGYRIQIANDSLFASVVFDTTSVVPDSLRVRNGLLGLNNKYYWRVNASNVTGTGPWSAIWNFRISPTGINLTGNSIPAEYKIYNNRPNPFNPSTNIKFDIPEISFVNITVYDLTGRRVAVLVNKQLQPGTYETDWNASAFSSGIYLYNITAGNFSETKKMILLK